MTANAEFESERERRSVQLRKGILELAILRLLGEERHYGYSLLRSLEARGGLTLKEGTLYPILARLDRDGLVATEWVDSAQGPPRKYYSLTQSGQRLLPELLADFETLVSLVRGSQIIETEGAVK